jgi:glycosyltransferase involved in cell wall biosynthesis
MRIKVIEALALGRPLVGSSQAVEGIDLISGEHAMIADDPDAFAREVLGLLDAPQRAETIGKAGQRLVRDVYDLENVVYALLEFYQRTFHPDVMPAT